MKTKRACIWTDGQDDYLRVTYFQIFYSLLCFFMYSCKAFSSSSLILRAEPVLLTTNFIQSCQVCFSILIEVLAFSLARLNNHSLPLRVIKVGGNYHKLHIHMPLMVMWYNGNRTNHLQERCWIWEREQHQLWKNGARKRADYHQSPNGDKQEWRHFLLRKSDRIVKIGRLTMRQSARSS